MIKKLEDVVVGDPVLVQRQDERTWRKAIVTKRTSTQICVDRDVFRLKAFGIAYTPDSIYRKAMRPFEQSVLDQQDAEAARKQQTDLAFASLRIARDSIDSACHRMRDPLDIVAVAARLQAIADELAARS